MKKLLLATIIFFSTLSVFAGNTITTDPVKGKTSKKENKKSASRKSTNKVMLCQVLEVKDENNNTTTMAVFAEAPAKANTTANNNTYLNHMFFADVKVVQPTTAVSNYNEYLTVLKQRYAGIKILGAPNTVAVK
jgi:hypothetical protein